jgi:hypothetical protein
MGGGCLGNERGEALHVLRKWERWECAMKYLSAAALAAMVFFLAGAAAQERGAPPRLVLAPGGVRIVAPDLVIRRIFLFTPAGAEVQQIHVGQPFRVCYQLKNIGAAATGPFRVTSDGPAGVPQPSHHNHGPLAAGESRLACFHYPTTDKVGTTYWAGVRADSPVSMVAETNEANNNRRIVVTIVP